MVAFFDNLALVEHQQPVQRPDRGEPVRDDERRSAIHQPFHGLLDLHFAFAVEARSGLVKDQHRCIRKEGTGNGDALAFPARELDAAFADHGLIPFWKGHDELMGAGLFCRLLDFPS